MPGSLWDGYAVSSVIASWLLTYALHSTLLLGLVWVITRRPAHLSFRLKETLWRAALLGGFATATLQTAGGIAPLAGHVDLFRNRPQRPLIRQQAVVYDHVMPVPAGTYGYIQAPVPFVRGWIAESSPWPYAILAGWAIGAAFGLIRFAVMKRRLNNQLRSYRRSPMTRGPLVLTFKILCRQARFQRRIRLTTSSSILNPCALGSSEICIPRRAISHLSADQQESMLAHELAHLARGDSGWLLFLAILQAVFFFQPLNIIARRRLQETAEFLCDEWAIRSTGRSLSLAQCIAEVATWHQEELSFSYGFSLMGRQSILVSRVTYLLTDRHIARKGWAERWSGLWLCGALLAFIWLIPNIAVAGYPMQDQLTEQTTDRLFVVIQANGVDSPPDLFSLPVPMIPAPPVNP